MSEAEKKSTGGDRSTWFLCGAAAVVLVIGVALLVVALVQRNALEQKAKGREAVVNVASQVLVNAYSFDFNTVDQALAGLAESSTGDFLVQQQQWGPQVRKLVGEQQAVTKAEIGNAAVQAYDDKAGTATVLFVFTAQSERKDQPSVTGRQAARVDVQRVDDAWKVSGVTPVGVVVPVGDSSKSVQGLTSPEASTSPRPSATAPSSTAKAPAAGGRATSTAKPAQSSQSASPAVPAKPGQ